MDAVDWTLYRNPFGQLVFVDAQGVHHPGAVPVRAFPIGAPLEGLSVVGADGHELAWVERLAELPAALREPLEAALAEREFVPVIRQIEAVSSFATPSTWQVDTDRGRASFVLRGEEDIRRLGRRALLIASSQGVQFSIPDLSALDRASRRLLERFL